MKPKFKVGDWVMCVKDLSRMTFYPNILGTIAPYTHQNSTTTYTFIEKGSRFRVTGVDADGEIRFNEHPDVSLSPDCFILDVEFLIKEVLDES